MTHHGDVAQLFARYGWANDVNDLALLEPCFTQDISFSGTIGGEPSFGPVRSLAAVLDFFRDRFEARNKDAQTRHVISNVSLTEHLDGLVWATAYLVLYSTEEGRLSAKATGVYDCQIDAADGVRFRSMKLALDGPL